MPVRQKFVSERLTGFHDIAEEIEFYNELPALQFDECASFSVDHAPLQWWKCVGVGKYKLYRLWYLASMYLGILASQAEVERLCMMSEEHHQSQHHLNREAEGTLTQIT